MKKRKLMTIAILVAVIVVIVAAIYPKMQKNKKTEQYAVGKKVVLGKYEQEGNTANGQGAIEWQVIAEEGSKRLLPSKYVLDWKPKHYVEYPEYDSTVFSDRDSWLSYWHTEIDRTWESRSLRKWLNNEFMNEAFSKSERSQIYLVLHSKTNLDKYQSREGATEDYVFLLSQMEVSMYSAPKAAKATIYAIEKGAYVDSRNENTSWLLRDDGGDYNVFTSGKIDRVDSSPTDLVNREYGIRPALWIDLDA